MLFTNRLIWAAAATLGASVLAGGIALRSYLWLPDPSVANQEELLRWVALRDVSVYPRQLQISLVNRLQETVEPHTLRQGEKREELQSYADQIRMNAELLKRVWFETRCVEYAQLPDEQRFAFLREQLDAVFAWATLLDPDNDASNSRSSASPDNNPQLAWRLVGQLDSWIHETEGQLRDDMELGVRDAVICWLSTTDLAAHGLSTRRDIALRLTKEFAEGHGVEGDNPLPMNEQQMQALKDNALLLIEAWLHDRAEVYMHLEEAERNAFVDRCLDDVQQWNVAQYLPQTTEGTAGGAQEVLRRLPEWIERADEQSRPQLLKFVTHVQQRVMLRTLQQLLPSQS